MRILYICTHNRCRSILSEALTNHLGGENLRAASAGSEPAGEVHPLSLKFLKERGIDTEDLFSKSWHEVTDFRPDLVITVCDSAAAEPCPLWMGNASKLHWNLQDPSKLVGTEEELRKAFYATMDEIEARVAELKKVARRNLDAHRLEAALLPLVHKKLA